MCGRVEPRECREKYEAWRRECEGEDATQRASCELLRRPVLGLAAREQPAMAEVLCRLGNSLASSDDALAELRTGFDATVWVVQANTATTHAKAVELDELLRAFDYAACGDRLAIAFPASSCSTGQELIDALTDVARPLVLRCLENEQNVERAISLCRQGRVRVEACAELESELRAGCSERPHAPVCPRPASCD